MDIKNMLRSGVKPAEKNAAFVYAKISQTEDEISITFSRRVRLDDLRESDTSLFACIQAKPEAISMLVTDDESGKLFEVPVDRAVNLNFFANWKKHLIRERKPLAPPVVNAELS